VTARGPGTPAVLAFRLLLLALAAGALATAVVVGLGHDHGGSAARYVCPMHPEVTAGGPGTCPICRMELEPINLGGAGAASPAVKASTYQTYDTVRWRGYGPDIRAPAWVEEDGTVTAVLYTDELSSRAPEQSAVFTPSSTSAAGVDVRATPDAPQPWDRSTSHVRFRTDASAPPLQAGEVGWLRLTVRPRGPPVIPYSAILEGADGPYVLVVSSDGRLLARRSVEIGRVFGGVAAVLAGLRSTERVLIRSAFYLDAERRLREEAAIEVTP
jgi:Heavy metal binding domain